jgi:hypothetical protein
VLPKQLAGDFVREKIGRLIDGQAVRAVVSSDTGATIGRFLADGLRETQPPSGAACGVIVVVNQFKNGVTGEREECVTVKDARLRLKEGVSAEATLVHLEDDFARPSVSASRSG